ncbi:MAG: beta-Ala-His dipeptidase, partial [Acidobacteriota bacterium]
AKGTTLGADNGIGVAAALAVMEDNSIVHGPLEFLFTVDEETGLTGATQIKKNFLEGKKLLNLDSEDEGSFTIGCAGGADTEILLPLKREKGHKKEDGLRIKISGFRGGHSGLDINQGRGNAIKLLARILWETYKEVPFKLISLEGGNKRNAIPREAQADLLVERSRKKEFEKLTKKAFADIRSEFKSVEKEADISFTQVNIDNLPLTDESRQTIIDLLLVIPHGVISMHPEIKGLVETSSNLAIIHTHKEQAEIICSSRSSVASSLRATREIIAACCELAGAEAKQPKGYPGWTPNLESPLLQTLKTVYSDLFNKEPEVEAVHAGLECGIIGEKFPGMDMISFGPTIKNPHSPEEKVHVTSVEKFYNFLLKTLETLA